MGLRKIQFENRNVVLPFEEGSGSQIKAALGIDPGRVLVVRTENGPKVVDDREIVNLPEGADVTDAPWHEYGFDPMIAQRLAEEAKHLRTRYRQHTDVGFDPDIDRWWVHVPNLPLPSGWRQKSTPILVTVDRLYPHHGPDGFLLSTGLRDRNGNEPAHYFGSNGRHPSLTDAGWGWFCLHPRGWRGDYDFRDGDSIAKYLTLIEIALAKVVGSR